MRKSVYGATVAAFTIFVSMAPAANADQLTDAFVANVKPNVDFLDKSSRLAVERAPTRSVRSYAERTAVNQTIVANSIVAWWQSSTSEGAGAALGTPPVGSAADLGAQLDRAGDDFQKAFADGGLQVGRSVGVAQGRPSAPVERRPLIPAQQDDLARLSQLHGRRFTAFYVVTQRDALRQLAALYRNYAVRGADPALRSVSIRQLEKVNEALVELGRL